MNATRTHVSVSGRHLPAYVFGRPRAQWINALAGERTTPGNRRRSIHPST